MSAIKKAIVGLINDNQDVLHLLTMVTSNII